MDSLTVYQKTIISETDKLIVKQLNTLDSNVYLDNKDKKYLLYICRVTLNNYFFNKNTLLTDFVDIPPKLLLNCDKIYVSLYQKGVLISCWAAKESNQKISNLAVLATTRAVKNIKKIYKNSIELNDVLIDVLILRKRQTMKKITLEKLKQNFRIGYDSIQLIYGDKKSFFKSIVPVHRNYSLKKVMSLLCKKISLSKSSYLKENAEIILFNSLHIRESSSGYNSRAISILNNNIVSLQSDVSKTSIEHCLKLCAEYIKLAIDDNGNILYSYNPLKNEKKYASKSVDVLRCTASIWIFSDLAGFFNESRYKKLSQVGINYLLKTYYQEEEDIGYFVFKGNGNIGQASFALLALLSLDVPYIYESTKIKLVNLLLSMEDKQHNFLYPTCYPVRKGQHSINELFYPGEALTALMTYYEKYTHVESLACVERVFDYYQNLFRSHDNKISMAAWMSKAYSKAFIATNKIKYANFIFEINDFVCNKQQIKPDACIDNLGAFSKSGGVCSAGVFLESIVEGYRVAKLVKDSNRLSKYRNHLLLGLRYLKQNQYDERYGNFYSIEALGGIRSSRFDPDIRIDNVQHVACAMLNCLNELLTKY